jgi:hypothetical protein
MERLVMVVEKVVSIEFKVLLEVDKTQVQP